MLSVKDLVVHYGAIRAIRGISFEVNRGEIITLIGSNGAGKTSTLHAVSNILKKTSGSVYFNDTDITIAPPSDIVRSGLVQSPEGRRVFADLSVRDNLEMGAYTRKDRPGIARDMDKVFSLFPASKNATSRMPERFQAVSSRCLRSAVPSWQIPYSFYWMNPQWVLPRFWLMKYSV